MEVGVWSFVFQSLKIEGFVALWGCISHSEQEPCFFRCDYRREKQKNKQGCEGGNVGFLRDNGRGVTTSSFARDPSIFHENLTQ